MGSFSLVNSLSFVPFHGVLRETEGVAGCSVGDSLLSGAYCLIHHLTGFVPGRWE